MAGPGPVLLLLLLLAPLPGAHSEFCMTSGGNGFLEYCSYYCCGTCSDQYCCQDKAHQAPSPESCALESNSVADAVNIEPREQLGTALKFSMDSDPMPGFGATVAIGLSIFVLSVVTIIICFTCSCCCLYKMCRRPPPVVTTTTSTTVVHAPYPQPPSVPPSYPGPTYQGYHPMPPQPGMPAAPYPTQYPPPYPAQPMGPPAYHETLSGGAAMPYHASQPPYNPAYMDPPKACP
ncbi:protein shisa-5 isoform X3 [Suncus etruscus]|uniref:protein shisa-5 isoform X3 n=2 Tax=Suncus etruscus TaxID=109475 RepID=UPI0021105DC1|nr:protein shisa-5 isoform X3 [Suncus etruscus]